MNLSVHRQALLTSSSSLKPPASKSGNVRTGGKVWGLSYVPQQLGKMGLTNPRLQTGNQSRDGLKMLSKVAGSKALAPSMAPHGFCFSVCTSQNHCRTHESPRESCYSSHSMGEFSRVALLSYNAHALQGTVESVGLTGFQYIQSTVQPSPQPIREYFHYLRKKPYTL